MSKTEIIGEYVEFIYCVCGCGFTTSKYNIEKDGRVRKDRPKRFVAGHQPFLLKGRILKDKAHNWKGDDVRTDALHQWVRKYNPPPKLCQICKIKPVRDLANTTGTYNREFKNWKYMCRKCHIEFDNLIERDPNTGKYRKKLGTSEDDFSKIEATL